MHCGNCGLPVAIPILCLSLRTVAHQLLIVCNASCKGFGEIRTGPS